MTAYQIGFDEYVEEMTKLSVKHHEPTVYHVYEYMKNHIGKDKAIAADELASKFGLSERELRSIVHEIRMSDELEKIIVSTNRGYYLATEGEANAVISRLIKHGAEEIKVARKLAQKVERDGQMKIQLGAYYKAVYESICRVQEYEE